MKKKKILLIVLGILFLALGTYVGIRYFYVFGEGVKTGQLNYVVKKGYIFKTYEGKLIQSGFKSKTNTSMGSNEFEFSVTNKAIAERLMLVGGKEVELRYKEYLGTLPWRGYSKYIVDSIINIKDNKTNNTLPFIN